VLGEDLPRPARIDVDRSEGAVLDPQRDAQQRADLVQRDALELLEAAVGAGIVRQNRPAAPRLLQDAPAVLRGVLDGLPFEVTGDDRLHLLGLAAAEEDQAALRPD